MPKRSYPFEQTCQPQTKVLIRDNDVVLNDKTALNKIYNKTLDMLFKGAKTKQNDEDVVDNSLDVKRDVLYDCNMCKSTSIAVSKCWFCNNMLCQNCEKSCNKCNETFCSSCSIVLYNDNIESTCLNCVNN